jgi:PAS domain S-box-containing protein
MVSDSHFPKEQASSGASPNNEALTMGVMQKAAVGGEQRTPNSSSSLQSFEHLRALLDNALDIITVLDDNGVLVYQSPSVERVLGYEPAEMLGRNVFSYIHPQDRDAVHQAFQQARAEASTPHQSQFRFRHKDGSWRTLEANGRNALQDPQVCGFIVNSRDITERKAAEDARQQSHQLLQMALDGLPSCIVLLDQNLSIVIVNASWRHFADEHKMPADAGVGQEYLEFCRQSGGPVAEATDLIAQGLQEVQSGQRHEWTLEFPFSVVSEGDRPQQATETRWLAIRVTSFKNENTASTTTESISMPRFVVMHEDITERKRAEETRAQILREQSAREQAENLERKSNFLAEASAVLGSSFDINVTLGRVARLTVPFLADWCLIDLAEEENRFLRAAVAHLPEQEAVAQRMRATYAMRSDGALGIPKVLRSGQSEFLRRVDDFMLQQYATDDEHLQTLRSMDIRSVMCIPLAVRGRILGVMTLIAGRSGRTFAHADLRLAEDLARRIALSLENSRLYTEAEKANLAKDEFLSVLSHELRTPLTPILGWVYLLREEKPDPVIYNRALQIIESNARAQERLIEDLIDVSRIVAGRLTLDKRPVELAPLIASALEAERRSAAAKDVHFHVVLNPNVGRVFGDDVRLRQVMRNLLTNAIKFTPDGGEVEVRLESSDTHARILVKDRGQGIDPEFLPHMFDRFRQADSSTARRQGGLGLGLTIVRHVVEAHGGDVSVQSEGTGKGATFIVQLPLVQPRRLAGEDAIRAQTRSTTILEGLKVLVVDDEADTRELLDTMLSRCGAQVRVEASANHAFNALRSWQADILVSDIAMPDEDGLSMLRRVRALPAEEGGQVPAIALTAYTRPEDRAQALEAGFQMHVSKPIDSITLAMAIAELCGVRAK